MAFCTTRRSGNCFGNFFAPTGPAHYLTWLAMQDYFPSQERCPRSLFNPCWTLTRLQVCPHFFHSLWRRWWWMILILVLQQCFFKLGDLHRYPMPAIRVAIKNGVTLTTRIENSGQMGRLTRLHFGCPVKDGLIFFFSSSRFWFASNVKMCITLTHRHKRWKLETYDSRIFKDGLEKGIDGDRLDFDSKPPPAYKVNSGRYKLRSWLSGLYKCRV